MAFLIREIMSQEQPTTLSLGQCPATALQSLAPKVRESQANSDPGQWVYLTSHSSLGMHQPRELHSAPKLINPPALLMELDCFHKKNSHQCWLASLLLPGGATLTGSVLKSHPSHCHCHGQSLGPEKSTHLNITNRFVLILSLPFEM